MEVLGAVAATGQLVGTAVAILDAISELRDFLRHAPARCQGWRDELSALNDAITSIRDNEALHTCQVSRIVSAMAPKITKLTELCAHYGPVPKLKLISRLNRARKARVVESRILQSFQSLEHDKTTLILVINALRVSIEDREKENLNMSNTNGNTQRSDTRAPRNSCYGTSSGASGQLVPYQTPGGYNNNHTQPQNPLPGPRFNNSPSFHPQQSTMPSMQPPQQQDDVHFEDVTTAGTGSTVGVSDRYSERPLKAVFKGLNTSGDGHIVGVQSREVVADRATINAALAQQNPQNSHSNGHSPMDLDH